MNAARQEFVVKTPGVTANLSLIREFVSGVGARYGLGPEALDDVALAVDEACSNLLQHGQRQRIDLRISPSPGRFAVILLDRGEGIPADSLGSFDLGEHLKSRHACGLGLYLIQQLMDEVKIEERSAQVQSLTMVKYHSAP